MEEPGKGMLEGCFHLTRTRCFGLGCLSTRLLSISNRSIQCSIQSSIQSSNQKSINAAARTAAVALVAERGRKSLRSASCGEALGEEGEDLT